MIVQKMMRTLCIVCVCWLSIMGAQAQTWSGWYLGGSVDQQLGDATTMTMAPDTSFGYLSNSSRAALNADGAAQTLDVDGIAPGIQTGINLQKGQFVWGFELDITMTDGEESVSTTTEYSCCAPDSYTLTQGFETGMRATIRPRLGWASQKAFLFITAGITALEIETFQTFTDTFQDAAQENRQDSTETAWIYGVGAEFRLKKNWSLKIDYLVSEFDPFVSQTTEIESNLGTLPETIDHSMEIEESLARIGFNYQF